MITIKTEEEIKIMREGGRILAEIMEKLQGMVKAGVLTKELDRVAEALILNSGSQLAFKGYEGFPAALCTSVNSQIVHVVPSDYELKQGDILSLDLGLKYKGFFSDMAVTVPVGQVDSKAVRLIETTRKSLELAVSKAVIGNTFGDIGAVVQEFVEAHGYNVVRELCGHGIGRELHEDPKILNYGQAKTGEEIKEGMVFCLEPMITMGDWHLKKSADGFGYETQDGSLSSHFEQMVAVSKQGTFVLTGK